MEEVSLTAAATIVILFVGIANLLGRIFLVKKKDKQSTNQYTPMQDEGV
jgi:hypothetical protein